MSEVVTKVGDLKKQIHCNNCFSILSWDSVKVERTMNGNRYITCPVCSGRVKIDYNFVNYGGSEGGGGGGSSDGLHWISM